MYYLEGPKQRGSLHRQGWICSVQCTRGKGIWTPTDAAQMWSAQYLKGFKIYLLPIFMFLFCLIKGVIKTFFVETFLLTSRKKPALSLFHLNAPKLLKPTQNRLGGL